MEPGTSSQVISNRGVILLLLTLATILPIVALPRCLRAKSSAQWPTTSGVITVSRIEMVRIKRGFGPLGVIRYRYHVGSTDYVGSRFSFNRPHVSTTESWQKVLDEYPVGKAVSVFYDPKDPAFAVLEPGLAGDLSLLYKMDLFFIAAFAASLLFALYKFREPAITERVPAIRPS